MANNRAQFDPQMGFTDDFLNIREDIRRYSKFLSVLVKLGIMHYRTAQVLAANHSQNKFEELRNGSTL